MNSTQQAVVDGASVATVIIMAIVLWVLFIIARWRIFTRAGEKGWKSIIPVYAEYVSWRIGWKKTGLFWLALVLVVGGMALGYADGSFAVNASGNLVATGNFGALGIAGVIAVAAGGVLDLVATYKLFKSFGKSGNWLIAYIFFPNITLLVFAFGKASYIGQQD